MKWLRSEEMEYISLIVNEDAAHNCVQRLGQLGVLQFKDLNDELTPFQRRYVSYIKRCDELERKIRYFDNEIQKFSIKALSVGTVEKFVKQSAEARSLHASANSYLEQLEHTLEDKENELLQLDSFHEKLTREYNEKKEFQEVLSKALDFMSSEAGMSPSNRAASAFRIDDDEEEKSQAADVDERREQMKFTNLTGVISSEERVRFERMVFRATRGNCYMRFAEVYEPIIDPTTNEKQNINVFIVFFKSTAIETKLRKLCDAFKARIYSVPDIDNRAQIESLIQNNNVDLNQANHIMRRNRESCVFLCREIAQNLEQWKFSVAQEKAVYHTLNTFKADVSGMLRAEGWVIKSALNNVRYEVSKAHSSTDKSMPSLVDQLPKPWPVPPTYFKVNKFTTAFQDFVDTYGVPRYQEINPSVFTTVTFPFLFGIMYGDMGHGTVLFLAGLYMVLTEKRLEQGNTGEMLGMLYGGRYMITLMGMFAIYAGLIYNDTFALGLNLFGSRYYYPTLPSGENACSELIEDHKDCTAITKYKYGDPRNVYSIGVDPVWHTSQNELLFFNSMKMKMSVIIGILQMTFGIFIKGWNSIYFRQWADFFFEFLPQLFFDASLFLYMVFLVLFKWSINWDYRMGLAYKVKEADGTDKTVCPLNYPGTSGGGCQPPSLINTLIGIVLSPGKVADPMFAAQSHLQNWLLFIAFLCVPTMLVAKPLLMKYQYNKQKHRAVDTPFNEETAGHSGGHGGGHGGHGGHGDKFEFGEIMIHQGIETIEFVLGMVSNTASYLRLWALSLAHSELATVFWEKAMVSGINTGNPFAVFIAFAVFAGITFAVLLAMDVLECFLHALRLHWVEFQNKFYKADGYRFAPFSFVNILKEKQASST